MVPILSNSPGILGWFIRAAKKRCGKCTRPLDPTALDRKVFVCSRCTMSEGMEEKEWQRWWILDSCHYVRVLWCTISIFYIISWWLDEYCRTHVLFLFFKVRWAVAFWIEVISQHEAARMLAIAGWNSSLEGTLSFVFHVVEIVTAGKGLDWKNTTVFTPEELVFESLAQVEGQRNMVGVTNQDNLTFVTHTSWHFYWFMRSNYKHFQATQVVLYYFVSTAR